MNEKGVVAQSIPLLPTSALGALIFTTMGQRAFLWRCCWEYVNYVLRWDSEGCVAFFEPGVTSPGGWLCFISGGGEIPRIPAALIFFFLERE